MKGFTFIELIITMGISSIIGVLLLVIIVNSTGVFYKQSSKLSQGLNINDAFSKIIGNIKQASSIAVSYINGSTTYTSGPIQLVLKIPSIDSSGNIILNTYDYFVYFLDQNTFRLKTFPDALSARKSLDQIFSTSVDSLNFQYFDFSSPPNEVAPGAALKIRVTIKLKQRNGTNFETSIATTEANLRNYSN